MKKILFLITALSLLPAAAAAQEPYIEQAMRDEMARSVKELRIEKFGKPYFIAYHLLDTDTYSFSSVLGGDTGAEKRARKQAFVNLRVGGKKLDNTGFETQDGWSVRAADSYYGIRHAFWDITDYAYKTALEYLEGKKAYIEQKNIKEYYDDFSSVKKTNLEDAAPFEPADQAYYNALTQEIAAVGLGYKDLQSFSANLDIMHRTKYYLDSDGSSYKQNITAVTLEMQANAQTKDGYELEEKSVSITAALKDLPAKEELLAAAHKLAFDTQALINAQKAEMYIGPVYFTGGAAAEILADLFVWNLRGIKPFLYKDGTDYGAGDFKDRLNLPVISPVFSVKDNPLVREFNGKTLLGFYRTDDEGAPAAEVQLTEKGRLINFLTTRSLIKGQKASNGHGRGVSSNDIPRSFASNIFFTPYEPLSGEELNRKFVEKCSEMGLEYCVKVTRLGKPFNAYKVYVKDGREEPFYGAEFIDLNLKDLRSIIAAGDDSKVYSFAEWRNVYYSIIAPSFIMGDIDIQPTQQKPEKKAFYKEAW